MDKQKQIEEMARIICKDGANNGDCDKCGFHRQCSKFKVAEKLYNAGYRKIPENAVVLTAEKFAEFEKGLRENWQKDCEKVRKCGSVDLSYLSVTSGKV